MNLQGKRALITGGTKGIGAAPVRLLVTNEFMTGETVVVDGGMSMQMVR